MYSKIVRYRPSTNPKAELVGRTHDMGGTDYEHLGWLSDEDAFILLDDFLYPSEKELFLVDKRTKLSK